MAQAQAALIMAALRRVDLQAKIRGRTGERSLEMRAGLQERRDPTEQGKPGNRTKVAGCIFTLNAYAGALLQASPVKGSTEGLLSVEPAKKNESIKTIYSPSGCYVIADGGHFAGRSGSLPATSSFRAAAG